MRKNKIFRLTILLLLISSECGVGTVAQIVTPQNSKKSPNRNIRVICVPELYYWGYTGRCLPSQGYCPDGFVKINTSERVADNDSCNTPEPMVE